MINIFHDTYFFVVDVLGVIVFVVLTNESYAFKNWLLCVIDTIVTPLPILLNYDSKLWDHFVDEISDVLLGIKEFISFLFP